MSIWQLNNDMNDYFKHFQAFPWRSVWEDAGAKSSLRGIVFCILGIVMALIALIDKPLMLLSSLTIMTLVTTLCSIKISDVCTQVRAESFGEDPSTSFAELRQKWMCNRYNCKPNRLITKARYLRSTWEEWKDVEALANDDTIGPRLKAFFKPPNSARLVTIFLATIAICATLISLGSDINSIFSALQEWRAVVYFCAIILVLLVELIVLWIMISGMLRMFFMSMSQQAGILPMTSRRVYSYILAIHLSSEPVAGPGKHSARFMRFINYIFANRSLYISNWLNKVIVQKS